MGRHRMLDEAKRREICALATAGMSMAKIAKYVGCDRKTIHSQRRADPEFDQQVRRARMAVDLDPREAMRRFAATHWRAAAWSLEFEQRERAARRAAAAERRHEQYIARAELEALADQVKRLVKGALLDPFEGPRLVDRIDLLFLQAKPAERSKQITQPPDAVPTLAEPTVKESIQFLERRWTERAQSSNQAAAKNECGKEEYGKEESADEHPDAFALLAGQLAEIIKSKTSISPTGEQSDECPAPERGKDSVNTA